MKAHREAKLLSPRQRSGSINTIEYKFIYAFRKAKESNSGDEINQQSFPEGSRIKFYRDYKKKDKKKIWVIGNSEDAKERSFDVEKSDFHRDEKLLIRKRQRKYIKFCCKISQKSEDNSEKQEACKKVTVRRSKAKVLGHKLQIKIACISANDKDQKNVSIEQLKIP